jgi:Fe-S-cluster containining protein
VTPSELGREIDALIAEVDAAEPQTAGDNAAIRSVAARLERIVAILLARGPLTPKDVELMDRLGKSAAQPRVNLKVVDDKHAVPSPDIDCAARLHLCHGRCCALRVTLSAHDVREGKLRWDLHDPYVLERVDDGYCTHLRPGDGGCEHYADRPAICRSYDCRNDARVWIDFDNRIPAPMPAGVRARYTREPDAADVP